MYTIKSTNIKYVCIWDERNTNEYSGSESTDIFPYFFLMSFVFPMQVTGEEGKARRILK